MIMDDDLRFSKIHGSLQNMMEQMLEIQTCAAAGERSDDWARNLRLLEVPNPSNDKTENSIRLWGLGERPDERNYLSVSYCWPTTAEKQVFGSGGYTVQTTNCIRPSRAPDFVLSTAIKYATAHSIPFIWIDQECIEQDQLDDKELGINSMDVVYRRGCRTLGILTGEILSQGLLDFLDLFFQHSQPDSSDRNDALRQMHAAYEILCILDDERWFRRAWVYQERLVSEDRLRVVMRYRDGLRCPPSLGQTPGYVEINLPKLGYGIRRAYHHYSQRQNRQINRRVPEPWSGHGKSESWSDFSRSMRHVVEMEFEEFGDGVDDDPVDERYTLMYSTVQRLARQENELVQDRLAILANICNLRWRLDTRQLATDKFGFSTCVVVLLVLNGQLPLWDIGEYDSLRDYLRQSHPVEGIGIIDRSLQATLKFQHGHLSQLGMHVGGWLWFINDTIDLTELQSKYRKIVPRGYWNRELTYSCRPPSMKSYFTPPAKWSIPTAAFLEDLQQEMKAKGLHKLAEATSRHIHPGKSQSSASPADLDFDEYGKCHESVRQVSAKEASNCVPGLCESHVDLTIRLVLFHVLQFGSLSLGRLSPDEEPLGLFTCCEATHCLTSCSPQPGDPDGVLGWESYVSMEVELDNTNDNNGKPILLPLGWLSWLNGLWFPGSTSMQEHVVPLIIESKNKTVTERIFPPKGYFPKAMHPPETVEISW
jgi:hypothetical protein